MKKDKSEWKNKMLSKKGISLFVQIVIIGFIFALYIISDYLSFGGTMEFIKDPIYWATTTISLVLVVCLMITIRNIRKDKQIEQSDDITNNMLTINSVRKVVLINAYDEPLQKYIDRVNEDYKYETYINKITKKINNLNLMPLNREKKDKLLRKYEEQLRKPREEVLKMHIRFKKITQTGLFAGVDGKLAVMNKHDISTHEVKDISSMIGYKALIFYILTMFSGTMVVNFLFNGWATIWGTMIKIFSLLFASSTAMRQADKFVEYNIEQALDNRLQIILGFVNSNEEIKNKVLEKIQEEKQRAIEKLQIKKESEN